MNARQKNLAALLAGAAVAGGLGLYAYFGVMKAPSEQTAALESPGALFPTAASSGSGGDGGTPAGPVFTWISLEQAQDRAVMELREGVWRLTSPVSALADRPAVLALVNALKDARFSATITESPTEEELVRFGLKPPRATVTARAYVPDAQDAGAEDPSRQRSVTLQVGIENVFDGSVYVRREGDPRVYTATGSLRVLLLKDTASWRNSLVFDLDAASLLRVSVKGPQGALVLERATTDKPWQMVEPMALRADPKRVARMFSDLKLYHALGYPEPEWVPRIQRALDKPLLDATLVPKNGEPMRLRFTQLELGGFPRTFVRADNTADPTLAQVDADSLRALQPMPLDFKSKRVLDMQAGLVEKIIIQPGGRGEPITLHKTMDSNHWEVVSPLPGRAREFKVASLLGALEKLEAEAVVATGPRAGARHGIGEGSRTVTLLDGGEQVIARLWLGDTVKDNTQRVWARGSSDDIYELSAPALAALPLSLEELLDTGPGAAP